MAYDAPGQVDQLSPNLVDRWNEVVRDSYQSLRDYHSRFFSLDPTAFGNAVEVPVSWFGDPAEPSFCFDEDTAQKLSDWGVKGRQELHNEYCEYRVVQQKDNSGRWRPKKIHITTELREYWVTIAIFDPDKLRSMVQEIIGRDPSWEDLYGMQDPNQLSPEDRKVRFSTQVAGHGNDRELANIGVPSQPVGAINRENVLFMTHPINGLDDLLYIVMFGARPYARLTANGRQPATKEQIFRAFGVEHLACRHADPAAATAAHQQAYEGRTIAFANPLGVYINAFTKDVFLYNGDVIPDNWVEFSRGNQRLQFGPSDNEDIFLDEITVVEGASEHALTGGYEVVKRIEVGPMLRISQPGQVAENEFIILNQDTQPIRCHEANVCQQISQLKREYEQEGTFGRLGPRLMGPIG